MVIDNGIASMCEGEIWTEAQYYMFKIHIREGDKDARATVNVQGAMALIKELEKFLTGVPK